MIRIRSRTGAALLAWGGLSACTAQDEAVPMRSTDSPMFRRSATHAAPLETRGLEILGGVAWRFATGGAVRSTPALAGGALYFGSTDGTLYAVSAADGVPQWSFEAGAAIVSSPAVTGSRVVFSDRANAMYGLDRQSGTEVWRVSGGPDRPLPWGWEGWDYVNSSGVVVADPRSADAEWVVIGNGDGYVYALRAEDGEIQWRYEVGARVRSTPAVWEGMVFVGGGDGFVYALDLEDGSLRWRFETAGASMNPADFGFDRTQIYSSPAVANGVVYVGSRDASLYAIDARTGEGLWHREDGSAWVISSPAVASGRVYAGRSSSGNLWAHDAGTGADLWVRSTGDWIQGSPEIADGVVHVGNREGWVFAFSAEDGRELWRYRTGDAVYSSPVVADGRLYVGSDDGHLYALEAGSRAAHTAVFWDDSLMAVSTWGNDEAHRTVATYFAERGYELLDGPGLERFMSARNEDRAPSVIVFAMDALPPSVASAGSDRSLFRRYLDAGGKAVWLGFPPLLIERDETGSFQGVDRARPSQLLSVDMGPWNDDVYDAQPTPAGRDWGLDRSWMSSPSATRESVDVVLAVDEVGAPAFWVKTYGGSEGSGFVSMRPTLRPDRLETIRAIAEYGILRTAGADEADGGAE